MHPSNHFTKGFILIFFWYIYLRAYSFSPDNNETSCLVLCGVSVIPVSLEMFLLLLVTWYWEVTGDSQPNFGFTFLGIYYEPQCRRVHLNHAVLVVGDGFEGEESDDNSYWLVKNRYKLQKTFIFEIQKGTTVISIWIDGPAVLYMCR